MRPNKVIVPMASQTYVLSRFPQRRVGTSVAPMIRIPPMVGVPFLEKWDCGPSVRIS
jgi:hypothetical protein